MKIEFDEYFSQIENIVGVRLAKQIRELVNGTLFCKKCGTWKKDAEFSKCSGKPNRRGRFAYCKKCQQRYYKEKQLADYQKEILRRD